jgi:hypothetical protein
MGKSSTTITTKKKIDGDDDAAEETEEAEDLAAAPLFGDLDKKTKKIDRVGIRRTEPDSGFMGYMPAIVSESMIAAKWGGGEYRLEGKNEAGVIVKVRTCKIAGDPGFVSEAEEKRWRKLNGLDAKGGGGGDLKDMLVLMEERDEKRRGESLEREERARKEAADREDRERRLRDERDVQARRDADEREERRRREAREDDERRQRIHREEMERLQAQNSATLAQSQQFFTQLAGVMKSEAKAAGESDPTKILITGMQIAREMSGGAGDGPDFLTALIQRLPETLKEVRATAGGVYSELTGKGKQAPGGKLKADQLLITGATALKAKKVLRALAAAGKDPEAEIGKLLDYAAAAIPTPATSTKTAPPAARAAKAATAKRARRRPPRRAVRPGRGRAA